jgi:hypothetical protein
MLNPHLLPLSATQTSKIFALIFRWVSSYAGRSSGAQARRKCCAIIMTDVIVTLAAFPDDALQGAVPTFLNPAGLKLEAMLILAEDDSSRS